MNMVWFTFMNAARAHSQAQEIRLSLDLAFLRPLPVANTAPQQQTQAQEIRLSLDAPAPHPPTSTTSAQVKPSAWHEVTVVPFLDPETQQQVCVCVGVCAWVGGG